MLEMFKQLVSEEKPNYMLRVEDVEYDGLHCVQCRYQGKDGLYYLVVAYYTEGWIAPNALGTLSDATFGIQSRLEDVAYIKTFSSVQECNRYPSITRSDLRKYLEYINNSTQQWFNIVENQNGTEWKSKLLVVPFPMILITISRGNKVLGTLVVQSGNEVHTVLALCEEMQGYEDSLRLALASGQSRPWGTAAGALQNWGSDSQNAVGTVNQFKLT